MAIDFAADLLRPGPVRKIRIDFTERCNLRCVYCSVSSKSYAGVDMTMEVAIKSVSLIERLVLLDPEITIVVNGNGETTHRKDWINLVTPFLESGARTQIQSNFAKEFTERELDTLSCMDTIAIIIDTARRDLLSKLRRHVDIRQIVSNIIAVRAAAIKMMRRPPAFTFACGLYDKNCLFVEDLARLAISLGIVHVDFWNLHDHGHVDNGVRQTDRVQPLDDLNDDDLLPRIEAVLRAIGLLRARRVSVSVQGDFVYTLARRVGIDAQPI